MNNLQIKDLAINPEVLKESGYKSFNDRMKEQNSWYIGSWQKRYDDENGRMYFINFTFFDKHKDENLKNVFKDSRFSWEADMQFNSIEEDMTINMSIFSSQKSLEQIEAFVLKMFKKMNFQYYEYDGTTGLNLEIHQKQAKSEEMAENLENLIPENKKTNKRSKKI